MKYQNKNLLAKLFALVTLISTFTLFSCATLTHDIVVSSHTDNDINIQNYKTFAWNKNSKIDFDPIGQWEQPTRDTDEEVRVTIEQDLLKRGFRHSLDNPDLLVTYSAGIDSDILKLSNNSSEKNAGEKQVSKSALVVAFTDALSGQTIWLAHADTTAQKQQSLENILKRIHFAIKHIFQTL